MRNQERLDVKPAHQRFLNPRLHYSRPEKILEAVELEDADTVLYVFGEPDMGSYEWMICGAGDIITSHSDAGYGIPSIALLNGLASYWGTDSISSLPDSVVKSPSKTA